MFSYALINPNMILNAFTLKRSATKTLLLREIQMSSLKEFVKRGIESRVKLNSLEKSRKITYMPIVQINSKESRDLTTYQVKT